MDILVVNGPNLNLLGEREPAVYGTFSLEKMNDYLERYGAKHGVTMHFFQSNHEGKLIDTLHEARGWADGIIINPGAYGHTSIAIRDAISGIDVPTVEVHISNTAAREEFRHRSMISAVCAGTIAGLGWRGYQYALDYFLNLD